ncbi:MAG: energy transducer TonB [Bacteroidales bacterium]
MKRLIILSTISLLFFNSLVFSQISNTTDSLPIIENAKYLKGDLNAILNSTIKYPTDGLKSNIQGDVVLSFLITKNGKLDSLVILSSPSMALSTASVITLNSLENEWTPCKINNKSIDKKYLIVFRYRMYLNTTPPTYKKDADKLFKKQKFDKALKLYNKAIKENQYDYELFEARALTKENLGDTEGAKEDRASSILIKNEILTFVDVAGIIRTKTVTKTYVTSKPY